MSKASMSRASVDFMLKNQDKNKEVVLIDPKNEYKDLKAFLGKDEDEPWDKVVARALGLEK